MENWTSCHKPGEEVGHRITSDKRSTLNEGENEIRDRNVQSLGRDVFGSESSGVVTVGCTYQGLNVGGRYIKAPVTCHTVHIQKVQLLKRPTLKTSHH
jgi:hypothetical protein